MPILPACPFCPHLLYTYSYNTIDNSTFCQAHDCVRHHAAWVTPPHTVSLIFATSAEQSATNAKVMTCHRPVCQHQARPDLSRRHVNSTGTWLASTNFLHVTHSATYAISTELGGETEHGRCSGVTSTQPNVDSANCCLMDWLFAHKKLHICSGWPVLTCRFR